MYLDAHSPLWVGREEEEGQCIDILIMMSHLHYVSLCKDHMRCTVRETIINKNVHILMGEIRLLQIKY